MSDNDAHGDDFWKESGTGGIQGQEMEYKYVALMFLRSLNPINNCKKFRLANNFRAVQKPVGNNFQDIGLQIFQSAPSDEACAPGPDKQAIYYIQLKYRQTGSLTLESLTLENLDKAAAKKAKGPFHLAKYYEWYKLLIEENQLTFPESQKEDITFVLYTTAAPTDAKLVEMKEQNIIHWHKDDFLSTSSRGNRYTFGHYFTFNPENCKRIIDTLGDDELLFQRKNFISKLRIYPEQSPSLDTEIKRELAIVYNISHDEVEMYYLPFLEYISDWWRRPRKQKFLTEEKRDSLWKIIRMPYVRSSLISYTNRLLEEIRNFGMRFEENLTLLEDIHQSDVLNLTSTVGTCKMSFMYLIQTLESSGYDDHCLACELNFLKEEANTVLSVWGEPGKPILIVLCENLVEDSFRFLLSMMPYIRKPQKVIFLNLAKTEFDILSFAYESKMVFKDIDLNILFSSLNQDSQDIILNKSINVMHGDTKKSIKLRDLKPSNLTKIKDRLNVDVLWLLMQNMILETVSVSESGELNMDDMFVHEANDPSRDIVPVLFGASRIVDVVRTRLNVERNLVERYQEEFGDHPVNRIEDLRELAGNTTQFLCNRVRGVLGNNEMTDAVLEVVEDPSTLNFLMSSLEFIKQWNEKWKERFSE